MVKQQYVWVLKPGKPSVDRKALRKMLGINAGIYTEASADVPAPLQHLLQTIGHVVSTIEPKLEKGKYSVISFPASCGNSKAMLMARMLFGSRLHTHYWLDPAVMPAIDVLLGSYFDLEEALVHQSDANDVFADIAARVKPEPNHKAAHAAALTKLQPNYDRCYWAICDLRLTINKRLIGLVKRGIANPKLFSA